MGRQQRSAMTLDEHYLDVKKDTQRCTYLYETARRLIKDPSEPWDFDENWIKAKRRCVVPLPNPLEQEFVTSFLHACATKGYTIGYSLCPGLPLQYMPTYKVSFLHQHDLHRYLRECSPFEQLLLVEDADMALLLSKDEHCLLAADAGFAQLTVGDISQAYHRFLSEYASAFPDATTRKYLTDLALKYSRWCGITLPS